MKGSDTAKTLKKIGIVVYDGFDELDAIAPYEVLKNAALAAPVDVLLLTLTAKPWVRASHGLVIEPQGVLDDSFDLVIVPGGGWADRSEVGIHAEIADGELPTTLARLHGDGVVVASVCTGAMLLAAVGITDDRPANTHPVARDDLAATGAHVVSDRVVDDGDLITAGGVTAGLDLALWIVEREWGKGLADGIALGMDYTRAGHVRVSSGI